MRKRKTRSFVWAGALFLGLSLAAGVAVADTSAGNKKEPAKGKTGDACKSNSDCDQSARPQSCRNLKCQLDPMPAPPT